MQEATAVLPDTNPAVLPKGTGVVMSLRQTGKQVAAQVPAWHATLLGWHLLRPETIELSLSRQQEEEAAGTSTPGLDNRLRHKLC